MLIWWGAQKCGRGTVSMLKDALDGKIAIAPDQFLLFRPSRKNAKRSDKILKILGIMERKH